MTGQDHQLDEPEGQRATDPLVSVCLNPALRGRDLLTDTDLSPDEILDVLHSAAVLKGLRKDRVPHAWLAGKTLGLIFQHPSTRTRTALQAAMEQLGGQAIFLGLQDLQLRRGETISDTAEVFSRYVEGIAVRVENRADMFELAAGAKVPVLNGLTSLDHPIEALSDVFTLRERFGRLAGLRFAYVGDGNNVCHSLLLSCSAVGISVTVAGPEAYGPDPDVVAMARTLAAAAGATVTITDDPMAAVEGADAVYTDVHESMGETVNPGKLMALAPFRVTRKLMAQAKPEAVFMHCLPLHRGQEVESEVADGPQSIIFDQAENRLHVHKAVLLQVLHDERLGLAGRESPGDGVTSSGDS
ncbi:MAG: Ornithine carbamoyltransferase [uncultured Thermomicrobiales bacterium]|uniref:Ornithine carbamoyltransferase n=1 Tax=uncultured Thermomicrobiales bacterium TaxID=1645740 RepID=A0A6J4UT58_9BACT|nr:MAG: Ornithine carbamoyltransferase [uncultured Thermomicrobiales bacterium]